MDSVRAETLPADTPVDFPELLSRCLGKREIAVRVLQRSRLALATDLALLAQAVGAADRDATARIAHRIKGAALAIAASSLASTAAHIETIAAAAGSE